MPKGKPCDVPNRRQLRHWEQVCLYLDSQPYRAVKHPLPADPKMSVKLFKRLAQHNLVRHVDVDCSYRLARTWRAILQRLWDGAPEDDIDTPAVVALDPRPFIADHNVDTLYVSLLAPVDLEDAEPDPLRKLPPLLAATCDALKDLAQAADTFVETPWQVFGTTLNMWKSGVGTSNGKGVSWSFLLRNAYLMLRLRRTPFNRLLGSVRFSAECLWTFGARAALDECQRVVSAMWADRDACAALTWQVSQVHLCADVANFAPKPHDLDRVLTYSRKRAVHVPSLDDEAATFPSGDDLDDYLGQQPDEWADLPDVFFQDEDDAFTEGDAVEDTPVDDDEAPADESGAAVYLYGGRASGFAFSPGGALSASWYNKELEERLSGKKWMRDIHQAGGWCEGMPLTRVEVRFGREVLREVGNTLPPENRWTDDPWLLLGHLRDLWGYFAGFPPEHDPAPDVDPRGWMRLALRGDEDIPCMRWPTDAVWQVIQRADFGQVTPPMPLTRSKTVVHDPRAIDAEIYGLLKLRSVMHRRQLDQTLCLEDELVAFAEEIHQWEALQDKQFYQEVREKARLLGRAVPVMASSLR